MLNRVLKYTSVLFVSLFMCTTVAYAANDYDVVVPKTDDTYLYMDMFQEIFDRLRNDYVKKVDDKKLIEAAINGMLKTLDPHTMYFNPEQFKDMQQSLSNNFTGIGAEVSVDEKTKLVKIVHPIEGSPAEKAGLLADDLILAVDGKSTKGLSLRKAVNMIRGPKGSTVKIKVQRKDKTVTVAIIRGVIENISVKSKMLDGDIGYIRVIQFNKDVSNKVKTALTKLQAKKPLKGFVLDLRNNPGGLLVEAAGMVDLFVKGGLIVKTQERNDKYPHEEFYAEEPVALPTTVPMVVLINQFSASASEIVSSSLKDLNRAKLVGVKSYGKGSVQTIFPLENGGGFKMTIAKYHTASGREIDGVGITPDVIVDLPLDWKPSKDKTKLDPQLAKAVEVLTGKTPKAEKAKTETKK